MTAYDIYIGTNGEEATSHGPEYVYEGMNPADAITKMVADADLMHEIRSNLADIDVFEASDDDMVAALWCCDDGSYELHIQTGMLDGADVTVTIPPTEYMSITDAADALGLTRQRVHALLQGGKLTGRMVGGAWIVTRASVVHRMSAR
jgi:hypothetical protein